MTSLIADARHRSSPGVKPRQPHPIPRTSNFETGLVDQLGLLRKVRTRYSRNLAAATSYFQTPIALISILDHQRQWFRASSASISGRRRDGIRSGPRSWAGESSGGRRHPSTRASGTTPCEGEPRIRFYAGAPPPRRSQPRQPLRHRPGTTGPLAERDVAMLEHFPLD